MAGYAYYALHKLRILPSTFLNMDENEKAFVIASIQIRVEKEKAEARKMKKK